MILDYYHTIQTLLEGNFSMLVCVLHDTIGKLVISLFDHRNPKQLFFLLIFTADVESSLNYAMFGGGGEHK